MVLIAFGHSLCLSIKATCSSSLQSQQLNVAPLHFSMCFLTSSFEIITWQLLQSKYILCKGFCWVCGKLQTIWQRFVFQTKRSNANFAFSYDQPPGESPWTQLFPTEWDTSPILTFMHSASENSEFYTWVRQETFTVCSYRFAIWSRQWTTSPIVDSW